jgi:putative transposase
MEDTLESSLVEQAFHMAVQNRQHVHGLLHHTDRGSQYAGGLYQSLLTAHNPPTTTTPAFRHGDSQ